MAFTIRREPTEPRREVADKKSFTRSGYGGLTVAELIRIADEHGAKYEEVYIEADVENDYGDYIAEIEISVYIYEDNASYKKKYDKYLKELKEYLAWYKANKGNIEAELKRRKAARVKILAAEKKKRESKQERIKELQAQISKIVHED